MTLRRISFIICLITSVLCLAAGYGIARQWIGVIAAIFTGPAWLLARKRPGTWQSLPCLLVSVSLAAAGRLTGAPALLMICNSGFSLATWDLLILDHELGKNTSEERGSLYETKHVQLLAATLGAGLLAACLGHLMVIQIPFAVLLFLIILAIFGLDCVWGYINKSRG
jgi:hypothetical protein